MRTLKLAAALSISGAMLLAGPAQAAPLTAISAAAKPMAQDSGTVQVRWGGGWHGGGWGWRGGGWGGGWGWGAGALAAGALIGAAAIASTPYYYGGYPYGYGYGSPYYGSYGYPYGYSSAAYYPGYAYGYRPYRRYYVHRSWRSSYGMYRVHHYRHHHWR